MLARAPRLLRALALSVALGVPLAHASGEPTPTEASLLEAWEGAQRGDPKTEVFEKTSEDTYRFKTRRFPFDGELRVLAAELGEELDLPWGEGATQGTVTVELAGAEEVARAHPQAYALWYATHTLYWDGREGRWLTAREYGATFRERARGGSLRGLLSGNLFWILFLAFLVVFFTLLGRKTSRQMKDAMAAQERALAEQARAMALAEQGLEAARDTNRLLGQILAEMTRSAAGGAGKTVARNTES